MIELFPRPEHVALFDGTTPINGEEPLGANARKGQRLPSIGPAAAVWRKLYPPFPDAVVLLLFETTPTLVAQAAHEDRSASSCFAARLPRGRPGMPGRRDMLDQLTLAIDDEPLPSLRTRPTTRRC